MGFRNPPQNIGNTQQVSIDYYSTSTTEPAFSGSCFFHSRWFLEDSLQDAGLEVISTESCLATPEDLAVHPDMWRLEDCVPYHFITVAQKP